MHITITKGTTEDDIAIERDDGSHARSTLPKKGPTPHDGYHYFVERELGMSRGFWGLVADGMHPGEVGALAAEAGHASAKRATVPDDRIVELLQAERLVECFEAESWSGDADDDGIMAMAGPGWIASYVSPPPGVREHLSAIRSGIRDFEDRWAKLAVGESVSLEWW